MEDRPLPFFVLIADRVQHQTLARRETDPELPFLPADFIAVHTEAWAVALHDVERLEVIALAINVLAGPVAGLRRQRHDPVIFHANHLHFVQIDDGDYAVQRPGVAIVLGLRPHEAKGAQEPPALVLGDFRAIVARRPRLDHHQIDILDAAFLESRLEFRRALDRLLTFTE